MAENCARPGCGHDHLAAFPNVPQSVRTVACFKRVPAAVIGPQPCPCRAYRTQAQQEAWEAADGFMQASLFNPPEAINRGAQIDVALKVVRRLLELYP